MVYKGVKGESRTTPAGRFCALGAGGARVNGERTDGCKQGQSPNTKKEA